jgi:hypothetical protein
MPNLANLRIKFPTQDTRSVSPFALAAKGLSVETTADDDRVTKARDHDRLIKDRWSHWTVHARQ